MDGKGTGLRGMVSGEFHDEGRNLLALGGPVHENDHRDRKEQSDEVHGQADELGVPAEVGGEDAGDRGDRGHLGAAAEEGDDADGRGTFLLGVQGTGVDHRGDAAAIAHEHRDEGAAREAGPTEDTVEDEGDTGHVTRILE